jgi:hypothetical protein
MKYITDNILKHRNDLNNFSPNTTYNFIPSDSEILWKENLKKKHNNFNNFSIKYYLDNPI